VNVKDTVGAGDTFWGSCLADWVLHNTLNNASVAAKRVPQTLKRALVAAAINCSRVGCQPPDVATLDAAL
jgi:fructokinase